MNTGDPAQKSHLPFSKADLDALGRLLTPSWLSGCLTLLVCLAVVSGTVAMLRYQGSSWQLLLAEQQRSSLSMNLTTLESRVDSNRLVSNLPLLIFWAGIGLIVYFLIMAVADAFRHVVELEQEIQYVHADRGRMIRQALLHVALRIFFLIIWVPYIQLTLHLLLPYVIALAYAGSGELGWLYNSAYLVGAVIIGFLSLHLHVILARLLAFKPRIFGQTIQT